MNDELGDTRSLRPRGEIENLCILSAIPEEGCALPDLPARLGLSLLLQGPIAEAILPMVNAGWVQITSGDQVHLTDVGREKLKRIN